MWTDPPPQDTNASRPIPRNVPSTTCFLISTYPNQKCIAGLLPQTSEKAGLASRDFFCHRARLEISLQEQAEAGVGGRRPENRFRSGPQRDRALAPLGDLGNRRIDP